MQVRQWLGIPRPASASTLDQVNFISATMFLVYALWILVTGKKF